MRWVLVDNDQVKLMRLTNVLISNGFGVGTRQINFDLFYCINVPMQYDMSQFIRKLPVLNDFEIQDRIIMIRL